MVSAFISTEQFKIRQGRFEQCFVTDLMLLDNFFLDLGSTKSKEFKVRVLLACIMIELRALPKSIRNTFCVKSPNLFQDKCGSNFCTPRPSSAADFQNGCLQRISFFNKFTMSPNIVNIQHYLNDAPCEGCLEEYAACFQKPLFDIFKHFRYNWKQTYWYIVCFIVYLILKSGYHRQA